MFFHKINKRTQVYALCTLLLCSTILFQSCGEFRTTDDSLVDASQNVTTSSAGTCSGLSREREHYLGSIYYKSDTRTFAGFALDSGFPCRRITLSIYLDGVYVGNATANKYNPNLDITFNSGATYYFETARLANVPRSGTSAQIRAFETKTGILALQRTWTF